MTTRSPKVPKEKAARANLVNDLKQKPTIPSQQTQAEGRMTCSAMQNNAKRKTTKTKHGRIQV